MDKLFETKLLLLARELLSCEPKCGETDQKTSMQLERSALFFHCGQCLQLDYHFGVVFLRFFSCSTHFSNLDERLVTLLEFDSPFLLMFIYCSRRRYFVKSRLAVNERFCPCFTMNGYAVRRKKRRAPQNACMLCNTSSSSEFECGELKHDKQSGLCAHEFCLVRFVRFIFVIYCFHPVCGKMQTRPWESTVLRQSKSDEKRCVAES
ncbi:unnamed protein product [Soboliphyme baturini]|uniref:RING-type domain-containing protein n=1 Tax=Soboliphyme baturini TaxID=241478 RepID=A0A183IDF4_9BILA|nr:unnamed protein product [Soboliphyme baturini]